MLNCTQDASWAKHNLNARLWFSNPFWATFQNHTIRLHSIKLPTFYKKNTAANWDRVCQARLWQSPAVRLTYCDRDELLSGQSVHLSRWNQFQKGTMTDAAPCDMSRKQCGASTLPANDAGARLFGWPVLNEPNKGVRSAEWCHQCVKQPRKES